MTAAKDWKIRFWEHVTKSDEGCWEWSGIILDGYGYLGVDRHLRRANRLSWKLHFGDIPDHLCVLHSCDNRRCVNPAHLFLGTPADNAADMVRKGRSMKGTRNHKAKLTPEKVGQLRADWATGKYLQRELGAKYGITQAQAGNIIRQISWKN